MCWGGNRAPHPDLRAAVGFWPHSCCVSRSMFLIHFPHSLISVTLAYYPSLHPLPFHSFPSLIFLHLFTLPGLTSLPSSLTSQSHSFLLFYTYHSHTSHPSPFHASHSNTLLILIFPVVYNPHSSAPLGPGSLFHPHILASSLSGLLCRFASRVVASFHVVFFTLTYHDVPSPYFALPRVSPSTISH